MKLDPVIHHEVIMSQPKEEHTFGIQEEDVGVIIEILRDKLYSNKRKIVVQEYMCNARDAHREIGNGKTPITVKLPNKGSPTFEVRDYGPGITPERMATVFVRYGASTKRDNDDETGGYGIGAKSAWSYCDQFGIITYVDGVKRHYSAFLDDGKSERGRVGKIALLHEEETEELNGTKIVVPVKEEDFNSFKEYVAQTAEFWDIRPNFTGVAEDEISFPEYKVIEYGNDWRLVGQKGWSDNTSFVIVDGIRYPIDIKEVNLQGVARNIMSNDNIHIFFKTGEVSISANRESLYYNDKTKNAIIKKLLEVVEQSKKNIENQMKDCKNLFEAKNKFAEIYKHSSVARHIGEIKWKDKTVNSSDIVCHWHTKITMHRAIPVNSGDSVSLTKVTSISLPLNTETSMICINDCEIIPSKPRLATLFDNNEKLKCIWIISGRKDKEEDKETDREEIFKRAEDFINNEGYGDSNFSKLSKVEKKKMASVDGKGRYDKKDNTISAWKCRVETYGLYNKMSVRINPENEEGIWVPILSDELFITDKHTVTCKNDFHLRQICEYLQLSGKDIILVPLSQKHKIKSKKMKHFGDMLISKVDNYINSLNICFSHEDNNIHGNIDDYIAIIKNSYHGTNCEKYFNEIQHYQKEKISLQKVERFLKYSSQKIHKGKKNIDDVIKALLEDYPLLKTIKKNYSCYRFNNDDSKNIREYIQLVDSVYQKEKVLELTA